MGTLRIFVSHSGQDDAFGIQLVEDLRQVLTDESAVWYDSRGGLHGGDSWWSKIVQEVVARDIFIIVLSPDAMTSYWVLRELDIAMTQRKPIIPLLYRPCDVRADLLAIQIIHFLPPKTYKVALQELLLALGLSTETRVKKIVSRPETTTASQKAKVKDQSSTNAVQSAIYQKWIDLGWEKREIVPITDEKVCADGIGHFNHFQNADMSFQSSIYWHPSIGAYSVQGEIRKKWLSLGWESFSYPITDEAVCSDGVGRFNRFRRIDVGPELYYLNDYSIYGHPTLGIHEIHGAIHAQWKSLGFERYGYPLTDEMICPDGVGRFSKFQTKDGSQATISWHPTTGAKIGPC